MPAVLPLIQRLPQGAYTSNDACLALGIIVPVTGLTVGASVPIATVDPNALFVGIMLMAIYLRTTAAITGYTAAPILTVGWSNSITTFPFATGVVCPTSANVATQLAPPASLPYGTPGTTLNLKVTNTPLGTGAGNLIVDLYGYAAG